MFSEMSLCWYMLKTVTAHEARTVAELLLVRFVRLVVGCHHMPDQAGAQPRRRAVGPASPTYGHFCQATAEGFLSATLSNSTITTNILYGTQM